MIWTLAVLVYFSAALQGVVLAAVILKRVRRDTAHQVLLGVLVLVFSLQLAEFAAYWTEFYLSFPHLLFATSAFPLLFGPLIYGMVVLATGRELRLWPWLLPQLVPFAVFVARLVPFYLAPAEFKREYYQTAVFTSDPQWSLATYLMFAVVLLHLAIYLAASWARLRSWAEENDNRSAVAHTLLTRFLMAWGVIVVLRAVNLLEVVFFDYRYIALVDHALLLFSSLFIYISVYKMLGSGYEHVFGSLRPPPEKYARSRLEPETAATIVRKAQDVMRREQLFLNPDLNLDTLAERLHESRYHVSQSLNQHLGKSFNQFVNDYRVRQLLDQMEDPESVRRSILDLAMDAGFNTKATFNSAFKKATGLTPSQYRDRLPSQT